MKISEVIQFLEEVRNNHGDLELESITGFWIRGGLVVPVVGNGESVLRVMLSRDLGVSMLADIYNMFHLSYENTGERE